VSTANGPVSEPERAFARRFRKLREDSGLTQLELAEQMRELGYGAFRQNTVYRIEGGTRSVKLGEALALTRLLGGRLSDLIALAEPPAPHEVRIRPVLEVSCQTCSGIVLDVTNSRAVARESREAHVAAMTEKSGE